MADESGAGTYSLKQLQKLQEVPYIFNFFKAVRLLECVHSEKPRIGASQHPRDDIVQFCQEPSLAFSSSAISAYILGGEGRISKLFVNFLGLLGPNGPMPLHITEYAHERILHYGDKTLARFLDIFNHRMISLFYRAWACNQKTVNYDRPKTDRFSAYLGSFFGMGMSSLQERDAISDRSKLFFSGHLACQTKHAEGLQSILREYFNLPIEIEQFVSRWIDLPAESHCRLGLSPQTGSLGETAIIGSCVWDCQSKFRIRMGPMAFAKYQRMLKGGAGLKQLIAWIRNYIGDELTWEIQLILKAREVPDLQLGRMGKLGWSTWLKSQPFKKDVDDCVLKPFAA